MDYVMLALLIVCCFRGWFKGLFYPILFLAVLVLFLLVVFKNSSLGQELIGFLSSTKVSGLFYKNVLEKIIDFIR